MPMRPPFAAMPMRALLALLLLAHAAARCTDTCATADDGSCDDGGADAHTAKCAFDTDCKDCGRRSTWTTERGGGGRVGRPRIDRRLERRAIAKGAGRQLGRRRRHADQEEPPHAPGAVDGHHGARQHCRGLLAQKIPQSQSRVPYVPVPWYPSTDAL